MPKTLIFVETPDDPNSPEMKLLTQTVDEELAKISQFAEWSERDQLPQVTASFKAILRSKGIHLCTLKP